MKDYTNIEQMREEARALAEEADSRIAGLKEIRAEENRPYTGMMAMLNSSAAELYAAHPQAAAYLEAERKALGGEWYEIPVALDALKRILAGNHAQALADMIRRLDELECEALESNSDAF